MSNETNETQTGDITSIKEMQKVKGIFIGIGGVQKRNGQTFKTIAIEEKDTGAVREFWLNPALERALGKAQLTEGDSCTIYRGPDKEIEYSKETAKILNQTHGPASDFRVFKT